jgi:hypothetical protein
VLVGPTALGVCGLFQCSARLAYRLIQTHLRALECEVSEIIGAMPFLWLAVDDAPGAESLRGYVERNAIALLSNFDKAPLDAPSANWLGHSCGRERVRSSGLWNSNHVDERYDPAFLACLEQLVAGMECSR